MTEKLRDIFFVVALGMIFGGCAALWGVAVAVLVCGVLLLVLLLRGVLFRPERKH